MTGLEQTFYIMAIVFMSLMFILTIVLVGSVFVIRSKVNSIHDNVERKIDEITSIAEKGGELSAAAGAAAVNQVKKVIRKAKK